MSTGAPPLALGYPLEGSEVRLVDGPSADEGVLMMRNLAIMPAYANLPEQTANALRDGWYYSGWPTSLRCLLARVTLVTQDDEVTKSGNDGRKDDEGKQLDTAQLNPLNTWSAPRDAGAGHRQI